MAVRCTVEAAAQAVDEALAREAEAEAAALSLAQRAALRALHAELDQAAAVFRATCGPDVPAAWRLPAAWGLPTSLRALLRPQAPPARPWWDAFEEALAALADAAERLDDLAAGQPVGAPARAIAEATAALLRSHSERLDALHARSAA